MNQTIYLAPLQGYTTAIYRSAFNAVYGGIEKYYTYFFETGRKSTYNPKLLPELDTTINKNITLIPQILTNDTEFLNRFCKDVADMGYQEINLNMGCPHPPIVNKKLGGGLLNHPEILNEMLNGYYTANSNIRLSIKMRLGVESTTDWKDTLKIINQYPIHELIIHPRTTKQQYKGKPHWDVFQELQMHTSIPIVGNGDILSLDNLSSLQANSPNINAWMIGRGILKAPWIINDIKQLTIIDRRAQLKAFHDYYISQISEQVTDINIKRNLLLGFWFYLCESIVNGKRHFRKLLKKKNLDIYKAWADEMLTLPFMDEV